MRVRDFLSKIELFKPLLILSLFAVFFFGALETSFAGMGGEVIPQIYEVDDFQDDIPESNFPKYYATGHGAELNVSEVVELSDPTNQVLRMNWNASQPNQWWYTNTWDDANQDTLLDATYYTHLVFKIKGAASGEDFVIELQELGGNSIGYKATDFITTITPIWQEIAIPLHYFRGSAANPGIDLTKVQAIALTFYVKPAGTIYIDDIRFVGCIIDDFADNVTTENKLHKTLGWGGGDIFGVDQPDGTHKIVWSHWAPMGGPPYWYTNMDFDSDYSSLNPKYYNYLYFRIKGQYGGEHFRIDYHTSWNFVDVDIRDYMTVNTTWQDVYIPLKDFTEQGVRREDLHSFAFLFDDEGDGKTIYIDDIELRYINNDPVIQETTRTFYKDYPGGFHINAFDADGDPLIYSADNLPEGATIDEKGFILWRPAANGIYPVDLYVHEDRKEATVIHKVINIDVRDYTGFVKPQSTGPIKLQGGKLFVNGNPYQIKGVGYQPVPIGQTPSPTEPWYKNTAIFNRDMPLLVEMGANAIRTWGEPSIELLDTAHQYGVKICVGYWVDYGLDPEDPTDRMMIKLGFMALVNKLKNHPAVLLWVIGNENNYYPNYNKKEWYTLVNEMAQAGYEVEGAAYHPVAAANGNLHNVADMDMSADDLSLSYLDIWGANLYPGYSINPTLDKFATLSNKPLWVSEYGIDAYHTTQWHYGGDGSVVDAGYLDIDAQADWDENLAREILASDITLGGTIMAYSDEWWKANNQYAHNLGGFPHGPENGIDLQPDNFANEEYWGLVSIAPDGPDTDALDDITLRPVYYRLKDIFAVTYTIVEPGQSIQAAIDDPASSPIIYVREGVYDIDNTVNLRSNKSIIGEGNAYNIVIKSKILFEESDGAIENLTILYPEGEYAEFINTEYPEGQLIMNGAGVTIINSNASIRNCIIKPDLSAINAGGGYNPPLTNYGKGIQIWNLYNNPGITLDIRNNLIRNADSGIYLYSQKFAGAINGDIGNNTLDNNKYGIEERMHNENPVIQNNIITNSTDAIHIAYDGGTLLTDRLSNVINNDFWSNAHNVWCDAAKSEKTPTGSGNIFEDPQYVNPPSDYTPQNPNCEDKGCRLN